MNGDIAIRAVDIASAAIVLLGVWLAITRSIGEGTWLLAAQSLCMGAAALVVGVARGSIELMIGGLLAIAVRAVVLPIVLRRLLRDSPVRHERHAYLGPRASAAAAIVIVFVAALAVDGTTGFPGGGSIHALPAAVAEVLTGLLLISTRRKSLSMIIGLLVFENGVTFAAFAITAGMPLVVELGISFDLLIVMAVVQVHARRMLTTFGSLSTDRLRSLRG